MIRIDCDPATLRIRLPECAQAITAASISREDAPGLYPLTVTVNPDATVPADTTAVELSGFNQTGAKNGVWLLNLVTECGCYETLVHLDLCPAPAIAPVHYGTGAGQVSTECCEPELQPDWLTPPTVASFEVTRPTPPTLVLTLDTPTPVGLTVSYDPLTHVLTLGGVPLPAKTVQLVDASGIVLATGITPALTLPDTLTLTCRRYWLRFTAVA